MLQAKASNVTMKAVQKLAGKLQFIAKGIPASRPYLRFLYNLLKTAIPKGKHNPGVKSHPMLKVWLNSAVTKDFHMWELFISGESLV